MAAEHSKFTLLDREGNAFEIAGCCAEDFSCLMSMYLAFSPRPASQGLPPADPEACRNWARKTFDMGENFLAWREGKVLGHAVLIPDYERGDCEFLIFVDQPYRNRGIGTALTHLAVEKARESGFALIWLTVESHNLRAVRLYRRFGFQFQDQDDVERTMLLRLKETDPT